MGSSNDTVADWENTQSINHCQSWYFTGAWTMRSSAVGDHLLQKDRSQHVMWSIPDILAHPELLRDCKSPQRLQEGSWSEYAIAHRPDSWHQCRPTRQSDPRSGAMAAAKTRLAHAVLINCVKSTQPFPLSFVCPRGHSQQPSSMQHWDFSRWGDVLPSIPDGF